jgi:hypothetical protein
VTLDTQRAKEIIETTREIARGVEEIEGVFLQGKVRRLLIIIISIIIIIIIYNSIYMHIYNSRHCTSISLSIHTWHPHALICSPSHHT